MHGAVTIKCRRALHVQLSRHLIISCSDLTMSSLWRFVRVAGPQLHWIALATVSLGLSSWAQLEVPAQLGVYLKSLEAEVVASQWSHDDAKLSPDGGAGAMVGAGVPDPDAPFSVQADGAVSRLIWLMLAASVFKSIHEVLMTVAGERVTVSVRGRLFRGLINSSMSEVREGCTVVPPCLLAAPASEQMRTHPLRRVLPSLIVLPASSLQRSLSLSFPVVCGLGPVGVTSTQPLAMHKADTAPHVG